MSVKDNLAFGLKRRSVDRAEIERRVANVAGILGLAELLGRKPHALSGGQRQRVALGRAIVRDPKVFLFDEPLSNLDAALRVSTRGEISALHRRLGATMIYVTHDQVEAMTMGTRICIMNGGRVAQVGPPLEVYRHPANTFVASFLGNPPMTLLPAIATDKPGGRCLKIGEQRDRAAARAVALRFRLGRRSHSGSGPSTSPSIPLPSGAATRNRRRNRSRGAARRRDDRDRAVAGCREAGLRQARRRRHLPDRRAPAAFSRCRNVPRVRQRWLGPIARLIAPSLLLSSSLGNFSCSSLPLRVRSTHADCSAGTGKVTLLPDGIAAQPKTSAWCQMVTSRNWLRARNGSAGRHRHVYAAVDPSAAGDAIGETIERHRVGELVADPGAILGPSQRPEIGRHQAADARHNGAKLARPVEAADACYPEGGVEPEVKRCDHCSLSLARSMLSVPAATWASNGFCADRALCRHRPPCAHARIRPTQSPDPIDPSPPAPPART